MDFLRLLEQYAYAVVILFCSIVGLTILFGAIAAYKLFNEDGEE